MKHLMIKDSGNTLITFNKGGSTLFTHTLKFFLNWKGIEIEDDIGRGNHIVICRNPIDRFYSGFIHRINWMDTDFQQWEGNKRMQSQMFEYLHQFVEECESEKTEMDGDFHYTRQGTVLKSMGIKTPILYQIEWLHPQIEEIGHWHQPSSNADYTQKESLIDNEIGMREVPLFRELGLELSGWDTHFFCGTYQLVLANLKWGHHRGNSKRLNLLTKGIYPQLAQRIEKWLEEDMVKFGYKDPIPKYKTLI